MVFVSPQNGQVTSASVSRLGGPDWSPSSRESASSSRVSSSVVRRMACGNLARCTRLTQSTRELNAEHLRSELRAGYTRADLVKGSVARSRRIVAKRRESAVVGGPEL